MLLINYFWDKMALFYQISVKMYYNCSIFEIYVVPLLSTGER